MKDIVDHEIKVVDNFIDIDRNFYTREEAIEVMAKLSEYMYELASFIKG